MGGGAYSSVINSSTGKAEYSADIRTAKLMAKGIDVDKMSRSALFKQKKINNLMNPKGITFRESRDSQEHPFSVPIVVGLDVTGSMMGIPHYLVKDGLPAIMGRIIQKGIADPQVLFLGIGDHECDSSPLQVGQFESSDDLLDKWLMDVYLEGGGGGNYGESYLLAWYFAAYHTVTDSLEKRGQKGFLFTIGDEPCLPELPMDSLQEIMGDGQYQDFSASELLAKAQEKYEVYHIHMNHGGRDHIAREWKEKYLGDNVIVVEDQEEVAKVIADIITEKAEKFLMPTSAADAINITASPPISIADSLK